MALFLWYEQFCVVLRSSPEAYIPPTLKSYNPYDPDHDIDRSYEFNTIRNQTTGSRSICTFTGLGFTVTKTGTLMPLSQPDLDAWT